MRFSSLLARFDVIATLDWTPGRKWGNKKVKRIVESILGR
jgi:hypothetical protein